MSERELSDLWDAVESLSQQPSVTTALRAEIRTILSETCESRVVLMTELELAVDSIKARVWWFAGATGELTDGFTKIIPCRLGG
ncbi:hypothetical protein [Oceanidesulfovibrio marinus]|uniref:Uncharacterized protein n=1 Tax=Oceanidesulfovibrio marinus TaxID=370038 RepID=A0A6P1ZBK8_9BACT|nr:hypothetical protein [Oceanidesulfovibrio marinus]TVM29230.1 hypothetical protein DQK91_22075 [Oceanidesulfovibrio marinus]